MEVDEDGILRALCAGQSMDYSAWPALLPRMIARIEQIAHEEFPIPRLPPPPPPPLPLSAASTIPSSLPRAPDSDLSDHFLAPLPSSPTDPHTSSSDPNKENHPVTPQRPAPPAPAPAEAPSTPVALPPGTLPPQLAFMLAEITSYLQTTFPKYPPHTIQRISELVLHPKQHYRSLATYLHALDRVVRVTSGLNVYPLPSTHVEIPGSLANGVLEQPSRPSWAAPGSDEALGGALLTLIPWIRHDQRPGGGGALTPAAQLSQTHQAQPTASAQEAAAEMEGEVRTESTETIDGPNGVGSIETVSVSVNGIPSMGARAASVTQGELLRQEQEAGLVPVSQLAPGHLMHTGSNAGAAAQQQIQARVHQQRALAQSQYQARAASSSSAESPDNTPTSASNNAVSTSSSATLEGVGVDADADNVLGVIGSVHSNNAEDEEKPHARGPQEIGVSDLGPQTAAASALLTATTPGSIRQGIDLEAAVGRKPLGTSTSSNSDEKDQDNPGDQMDIEGNESAVRASTPKRDAESELEGSASKKLKEDSSPPSTDADMKPADPEAGLKSEEEAMSGDGEAMDKD
ncbi:hypothetical protein F4777DRAFT_564254 [Nemania sp. FL0916]|nr:hypothetical protein F4777DRAFT_564254 [Nemania sp. FL0916]